MTNSIEKFIRSKSGYHDILCCYIWVCPFFVLEPKLQKGQKPPRWNLIDCLGQCCGFWGEHSSLVDDVKNLSTGYISPYYHLVDDDLFETVICKVDNDSTLEAIYSDIFDINRYWYTK